MNAFTYQNGQMHAENVSLETIAQQVSTPCYVYSKQAILDSFNDYHSALGDYPGLICYAVKANSNLAVLNVLARAGAGFDIVSGGELERVLAAGGSADRVIFSGVGKTRAEMQRALEAGIACFNIESIDEIDRLASVAAEMGVAAPISLRVNPDVDAKTHPYISTGLKENKFGIDISQAEAAYRQAAAHDSLAIKGIDCHIGSQLTDVAPLLAACDRLIALYDKLYSIGIHIEHLDLGGGIGIVYNDETLPSIADYIAEVKQKIGNRPLALFCEPGRSIVGNAGVLVTRVEYLKQTPNKNFAVIDAAMNDYIRPALYSAWQHIKPVKETSSATVKNWDFVGPICESGDFIGRDRDIALAQGDLVAIMSTGAYGFTMSSNYNTRPRVAEVMVDGDHYFVVRQREQFADLIKGEAVLP